ncbi:MAG: hypothetical protein RR630_08840 [Coprobacillus sp.]
MASFIDNDNYSKEQKVALIDEVVKLYKEFVASDDYIPYLQMERDKWVIDYRMQEHWDAGYEEGLRLARVNRSRLERLKEAKLLINGKYQRDDLEWLDECNEEQLGKVVTLVFKDLTYDELKEKIVE